MNTKAISSHAAVAKACKAFCKSKGIPCKATSSSFSMGDSVRVKVENQPPHIMTMLNDELKQYQYGHFNGMEDIYEYSNSRDDVPQTKYLSIDNSYSEEMHQKAWSFLRATFSEAEKYPENYKEVPSNAEVWGRWASQSIYQLLNGSLGGDFSDKFWESISPKQNKPAPIVSDSVEIREGTKPGFSEVVFPSRPDQSIIETLKAAGFRWSRFNGVWYGLTENLPDFGIVSASPDDEPPPNNTPPKGDKFRTMADKLTPQIAAKFGDRLENTPKRLAQGAHARLEGERLERTQKALFSLAALHDSGTVPAILSSITSKTQIYDLMAEKTEACRNGYHEYRVGTNKPYYETPQALALWALLTVKSPEQIKAEELAEKVRKLKFVDIPGYFPTPSGIIERMANIAELMPSDRVLDPSLGHGSIADYIKPMVKEVKGFEVNHSLADICDLKDYLIERRDFLTVQAEGIAQYDKVMMNPPFENLQDAEHVRHAFKFLKPGGKLVSIMSPSAFFVSNKKAEDFREWLSLLDAEVFDIEAGAFKESGTMIASKMLVIHKGAQA